MTRFYFDVRKGDKLLPDKEGLELSTIDAAQQEAVDAAAVMARDAIRRNPDGVMAIEVRDHVGTVLNVRFHWTLGRYK